MRNTKKVMLAASLLVSAAAMTGCTADMRPAATPSPQAMQQQTAEPDRAQESKAEAGSSKETPETMMLFIDGKEVKESALIEGDALMLPLAATAQALGWDVKEEKTQEETQEKHVIVLEKDESRITVSYTVSDNTIRQIA